MNNNDVISIINNLIESCRKGQTLFKSAGECVQNHEFRRLFNIFSQQRAQFMTELQAEAHRLGGTVNSSSSMKGAETRAEFGANTIPFRNSHSAKVIMRDEVSIIEACQREEENAINEFEKALQADLPLDVGYVLKRQYMDIRDAYDRIRILQRAA